jgi:2'-5' RNA ligase
MRLFAGIPLDVEARAFVAAAVDALKHEGVRARWTPPENWHVTLAFLGDVDSATVPAITAAFNSLSDRDPTDRRDPVLGQASLAHDRKPVLGQASLAPFSLHLSTVGAFPNPQRPRVLWVGGHEQEALFDAAALALRSSFEPLGFHFDELPMAHVTIGRSTGSAPLRAPRLAAAHAMPVTRLVLFESIRTPAGVRYEEREVIFLSNNVVTAVKKDRT